MKTKEVFAYIFLTTLAAKNAQASDQFFQLYLLSEDIRDVVLEASGHPMPKKEFELSTKQADQMLALASMDDSMRVYLENSKSNLRDCNDVKDSSAQMLQARVDERKFAVEAMVVANNLKYEQNALGRFMNDDYMVFLASEYYKGNTKAWEIYSVGNLEKKFKESNPVINLDSMSLSKKEEYLNKFAAEHLGTKLPEGLLMKEMAFQSMVNDSSGWKKVLQEAKGKLSSDQKIQLVSKLGGYFGNNYNYDRNNAGSAEYGKFISTEKLLDSAKFGTPGGICRDIALAQVQFLDELGFKDNYIIGYKTLGGRHATVITTDPVTKKVIKFNYDETTEVKAGSGTEALTQDTSMPGFGLKYRIYDSKGKPVTKVSSELSRMLQETATDEPSREFGPKNYSLAKVGFKTDTIDGNIFTGKTSLGLNLYGVALYKNNQINEYVKSGTGVSYSKLSGRDNSHVQIDQSILFLKTHMDLTSPAISIGPVQTSLIGGLAAEAAISTNKSKNLNSNREEIATKQIDADVDFYVGVQNKVEFNDKKTAIDNKVYVNFYPDWNHEASGEKIIPTVDNIVIKTGVSHKVTDDTKALVDTAVIVRKYGTSLIAQGILENEKKDQRMSVGVATPLTKDMPSFLPGGERRVMASIEKAIKTKNVILSIEVGIEKNLDTKATSVSGKAKGSF
jgi:hypothetical protein